MPDGYLVQLGDGSLDPNDGIGGPLITFTTDTQLGAGQWIWSGTWNGQTFTNTSEPGVYFLATDGSVYFVPDFGPVTTISSATVQSAPTFSVTNGPVDGTIDDDIIDASYTDAQGDSVDSGNGGGAGGNDDTINAGAGNDSVSAGLGNDSVLGGAPAGTIGPIRVTGASDPTDVAMENQKAKQDTQTGKKPQHSEKARRLLAGRHKEVRRVKSVYTSEFSVYFSPRSGQAKASG